MKKCNLKILLPVVGYTLLAVSVLALQNIMAGIGLGLAGLLIFGPNVEVIKGKTGGIIYGKNKSGLTLKHELRGRIHKQRHNRQTGQCMRIL